MESLICRLSDLLCLHYRRLGSNVSQVRLGTSRRQHTRSSTARFCCTITHMQLRGAMLYVRDLERMTRFYSDMLGIEATIQSWTSTLAIFDTGDVRFALHAIPAGILENIEIACPPVPREHEPVKLIFEVKDVEDERERLEPLGARTLRRPWQQSGEACDAVDPEGNIFQLCSSTADVLR